MSKVSEVSGGRWSDYIDKFIGDWEAIGSDIEEDYQGSCAIVGYKESWYNGDQYAFAEWSYGSCSGCDGYEDMGEGERLRSFLNQIEFVNEDTMLTMARNSLEKMRDDSYWNAGRKIMFRNVVDFIENKRTKDDG